MPTPTLQLLAGEHAFLVRDLLSPEECTHWIARAEGLGFGAAPITTLMGERMKPGVRNNTRVIYDSQAEANTLWSRLEPLTRPLSRPHPTRLNERLRVYRYEPGQYFKPHLDGAWRPPGGEEVSIYSVLVYLNADFEGGETRLFQHALDVRPEPGMALFFTHRQLHSGATVTAGRKYVLRTDLMFPLHG